LGIVFFVYFFWFYMIISSINLWCTKNLVDTQFLIWKIFSESVSDELQYCSDPFAQEVGFVFLNTCGFISSSRQEMFVTLEELLNAWKKIYLWWCAVQYFEKLLKYEKNMDNESRQEFTDWQKFLKDENVFLLSWEDVKKISLKDLESWFCSNVFEKFVHMDSPRFYSNIDLGYEYLKIAEGCNNQCAFCAIPKIRGKQQSLSIEKIVLEVQNMLDQWAKEIILIAQDSTRYGVDLINNEEWKMNNLGSKESWLLELLKTIDEIEGDFVYRVLYLYPDVLTFGILDELVKLEKFVPYFDLPLQHINSDLLQKMWRFSDVKKIRQFLKYIRDNFETSYIRTNLIVWFPWETSDMVEELMEFVGEGLFDNVALFEYHDEPLAPSYRFENKVEGNEIRKRFCLLRDIWGPIFEVQEKERKKEKQVWFVQEIFSKDEEKDGEWWSGKMKVVVRPRLHAPEIDSVDEIDVEDVLGVLDGDEVEIGSLVKYVC